MAMALAVQGQEADGHHGGQGQGIGRYVQAKIKEAMDSRCHKCPDTSNAYTHGKGVPPLPPQSYKAFHQGNEPYENRQKTDDPGFHHQLQPVVVQFSTITPGISRLVAGIDMLKGAQACAQERVFFDDRKYRTIVYHPLLLEDALLRERFKAIDRFLNAYPLPEHQHNKKEEPYEKKEASFSGLHKKENENDTRGQGQ